MHGDDDVKIDTKVTFDLHELAIYTYAATRVKGSSYLVESGALFKDYVGKQFALTNRTFVPKAVRPATSFVVKKVPTLALATGFGMAVHAYGQTSVGQMTRKSTLYKTIRSGMS